MSLERILICKCGHYLEWHGKFGCLAVLRTIRAERCSCMLTRREMVEMLVGVERDEIRAQWADPHAGSAPEPS
ncbi:MAG: hypothetical protein JO359_05945 [Candidatus Eremiobacteraeota bacterium]|nr:hypothetical protein [Candidatus Eremiobacteraeota bacterium]